MKADYDQYHNLPQFANLGKGSYQGDKVKNLYPSVQSVFDFGCGSGYAVHKMKSLFQVVHGYEPSKTAYEKYLRNDPVTFFTTGDEIRLQAPVQLLYSTEVMEHIPEEELPSVMNFFAELNPKYIFMTISLRPSSDNNAYHCTLRSRDWWEKLFAQWRYTVDKKRLLACQAVGNRSDIEIFSQWASVGPVGVEFAKNPPYPLYGEEQPWFFIFERM